MRYILKELLRHRLRTAFGIIGYAIASLFILMLLSLGNSNKKTHLRYFRTPVRISLCISEQTASEIMSYLRSLNKEKQVTVLFATHGLTAGKDADRIIKIKEGHVEEV